MLTNLAKGREQIPNQAEFIRKGTVRRLRFELEDEDGNPVTATPGPLEVRGVRANVAIDTGDIDLTSIEDLTPRQLGTDPANGTAAPHKR